MDKAVMDSGVVHQNLQMQYLNNKDLAAAFQGIVLDMLLAKAGSGTVGKTT